MKYFIFFSAVAVMTGLAACTKILDTNSPSDFTSAVVFSNTTEAQKAVSGVYALFNQDAFTSRVSNNFTGNSDIEFGGAGAAPDNSRRDIWTFECTDANADLLTVWNNAYKAINAANEVVDGIQKSDIKDDKMMQQILGEAFTLRAIWFYLLVNHWGDVPYKTTPSKAGDDFYQPRYPRDSILSKCIHDLVAIEPNMYWAGELDYGIERINREFVMGMIARLSLMRGGYWLYPDLTMQRKGDYQKYYDTANIYCKKLVSMRPHQMSDFSTVFMNENKYIKPTNDDVLYEVAFQPGFGDVGWCNGVRVDGGSHPYGGGSNYLSLPITYYHSFDTLDSRLPVTCSLIYYDGKLKMMSTGSTSIAPGKWDRRLVPTPLGSASTKGTGINWPMMRYADVLLMLAESENELKGPDADAISALKAVRKRAFASTLWPDKVDTYVAAAATSKASFFTAIVNERAWEFGGECLRKYDLERWNLYGQKVAEIRNTLTQWGKDAQPTSGSSTTIPDYMYYKWNSDSTVLTWLNKYTKPAVVPAVVDVPNKGDNPGGYQRVSWAASMYSSTNLNNAADFIIRTWRGYTDNTGTQPLRYILPVHSGVVTSSRNAVYNAGLYGYK